MCISDLSRLYLDRIQRQKPFDFIANLESGRIQMESGWLALRGGDLNVFHLVPGVDWTVDAACSERATLVRLSAYHRATLRVPAEQATVSGVREGDQPLEI